MTATIQLVIPTDKPYSYSPLFAKQGDYNSRYYSVTLQSEGKSVSISDDASVCFNVKRSDGISKVFAGTVEDGKAICPLPAFATEIGNATVICSVSVIDGESRFTTSNFVVFIQSAESTDTDITEDENYDVLTALINQVQSQPVVGLGYVSAGDTPLAGATYALSYVTWVTSPKNMNDSAVAVWYSTIGELTYIVILQLTATDTLTVVSAQAVTGPVGEDGQSGATGADGIGISSIEKTATSGLVDTYTITFSDGTTSVFTVTNGATGATGVDGVGIASVEQTTTSTESSGTNVVTVTLTDGTTSTINITNGAQSEQVITAESPLEINNNVISFPAGSRSLYIYTGYINYTTTSGSTGYFYIPRIYSLFNKSTGITYDNLISLIFTPVGGYDYSLRLPLMVSSTSYCTSVHPAVLWMDTTDTHMKLSVNYSGTTTTYDLYGATFGGVLSKYVTYVD